MQYIAEILQYDPAIAVNTAKSEDAAARVRVSRSSDHARARRESSVFQCARSSRAVPDNNKAESSNRCHNNITLRHNASSATVGLELQASAFCNNEAGAGESYVL
eukprot:scaffold4110_cov77-Skeletonema_dohrnii-CCMP3373.AAC.20